MFTKSFNLMIYIKNRIQEKGQINNEGKLRDIKQFLIPAKMINVNSTYQKNSNRTKTEICILSFNNVKFSHVQENIQK